MGIYDSCGSQSLGITVVKTTDALNITGIDEVGLVSCCSRDVTGHVLQTHDEIWEVNGIIGAPDEMFNALLAPASLTLKIRQGSSVGTTVKPELWLHRAQYLANMLLSMPVERPLQPMHVTDGESLYRLLSKSDKLCFIHRVLEILLKPHHSSSEQQCNENCIRVEEWLKDFANFCLPILKVEWQYGVATTGCFPRKVGATLERLFEI